MFPLWDEVIEPVLRSSGARRVVEIGALRGENTVKVLAALGPDAELHVIDPAPEFDPSEHERAFAGRYEFHRGLSIDVLPDLPPVDAALIDGDHNYYTVSNELRLLAEGSRRGGRRAPAAHPARRRLAVRPPRPVLRPGDDSRTSTGNRTHRRACDPGHGACSTRAA